MNFLHGISRNSHSRKQAERIVRIVTQEGFCFRGALLGKRREGKTDFLRQVHAQLFEMAEGPIPFLFSFPAASDEAALARHYLAAFCQQVRAFLMRQEEMLLEPVAGLEPELERAGLPLSLTEMARNFLSSGAGYQLECAGTLAAQFAHREGRPLCLFFDDIEVVDPNSPIFRGLVSPYLSWMVTGRQPFVARLAGAQAWPVVRLEPFSRDEALAIAKKSCGAAGTAFSEPAWAQWFQLAGTSAWLIDSVVQAAAIHGELLDSVEQLGRIYFRDLASGTLGNWFARRFEQAVPRRLDRAAAAALLAGFAKAEPPAGAPAPNPELADGLIAEEWAVETARGSRIALDSVQRDWLSVWAATPEAPLDRSQTRALQDFLLRVRLHSEQRSREPLLTALRNKLAALPQTGLPKIAEWSWLKMYPSRVSVSSERSGHAELFWCYALPAAQSDPAETISVLLIVLCEEAPSAAQVDGWRRQLEKEAGWLPRREAAVLGTGSRPRHDLLLLVPPGTSLDSMRSELRFPWEVFAGLLEHSSIDSELSR